MVLGECIYFFTKEHFKRCRCEPSLCLSSHLSAIGLCYCHLCLLWSLHIIPSTMTCSRNIVTNKKGRGKTFPRLFHPLSFDCKRNLHSACRQKRSTRLNRQTSVSNRSPPLLRIIRLHAARARVSQLRLVPVLDRAGSRPSSSVCQKGE